MLAAAQQANPPSADSISITMSPNTAHSPPETQHTVDGSTSGIASSLNELRFVVALDGKPDVGDTGVDMVLTLEKEPNRCART